MKELPTIITVTYDTWETYTKRLVEQFLYYIKPNQYEEWIIVDNNSSDRNPLLELVDSGIVPKLRVLLCQDNIADLPRYNDVIPKHTNSEFIICISTDMKIFKNIIPWFMQGFLEGYDMIGCPGPKLQREHADKEKGGPWHWVPELLVVRNLEFDNTEHIQTHCFATRKSVFKEVGGFWVPPTGPTMHKGDLISGEMYYSIKLRRAGYKLGPSLIPAHHYGNGLKTYQAILDYDKKHGWGDVPRLESYL